jgi:iron complex outermembrane recepter protein
LKWLPKIQKNAIELLKIRMFYVSDLSGVNVFIKNDLQMRIKYFFFRVFNMMLVLLMITLSLQAQQKQSLIRGRVFALDGKPVSNVNVVVEELKRGGESNQQGEYILTNLPAGQYTLSFSFIGLQPTKVKISLSTGQQLIVPDVTLAESAEKLNEVEIVAQRRNQFAEKTSEYVSRMPLKNIENAQAYSIVTSALMKEQVATDVVSSFKSITGGGPVQSNDGNATVYIRGFRSDASVRNGMLAYTRVPVDPQNTERIEIIKGPSATLFGGSTSNVVSSGGVINRVTKRPKENKSGEVSYSTGSASLNRIALDYNTPLNPTNSVLFRINSAYHTENSFQDQGYQKNFMVAPSLTAKLNDRMVLSLEAEYYQTKRNLYFARGVNLNKVKAKSFDQLKLDYNKAYTSNDMAADMNSINYSAVLDTRISDNWRSKTSFMSTRNNTQGHYFRLEMVNDSMAARNFISFLPRNTGSMQLQQDFNAQHKWGWGENQFLAGISYAQIYDDYQRYGSGFVNYDTIKVTASTVPSVALNTFSTKKLAALGSIQTETSQSVTGVYVADVLKVLHGLVLSGGVRYDMFRLDNTIKNGVSAKDKYTQNSWSPKVGVLYNFKNMISAFANYQNGFTNQAPSVSSNGNVTNYKPVQANQAEFGLKVDLFEGKLMSTISYYDIRLKNILRQNPSNTTETLQDGEQTSKGFEADLIANPFPGFNLVAGYTYNKAEFVKVTDVSIIGNRPSYTPQQMANIWASYRVISGSLKGIGMGAGSNYVSKIYINDANSFWSPSYAVMDAVLFYDQPAYRLSVKMDNLTNKHYWNAYGMPQKTRSLIASVTVRL